MNKRTWLWPTLLLSTCLTVHSQVVQKDSPSVASEVQAVAFCDLVHKAADYEGKEVKVRALYHSGLEWSAFSAPGDKPCDDKSMVWVEFDNSFDLNSRPAVLKKLDGAFYRMVEGKDGRIEGQWLDWQTELLVTGRISKPSKTGYGHTNSYALKFVVTGVEEVGPVKKVE